jgi:glycosyltransferase involved in cell wall biosynthesis
VFVVRRLVHRIDPIIDIGATLELASLFRKLRADLIHLHTSKAGLVGRVAARLAGIPCVYTPHGWCFSDRSSPALRLVSRVAERLVRPLGNAIIAVSQYERQLALEYRICSPGFIKVIYNGVPDTPYRAHHGPKRVPVLVMVARFASPKAQGKVIVALQSIAEPYRLLFVGDGPTKRDAERLAASLGLTDKIVFLGARTDVDRILAGADLMVHASGYEALCLSAIEAMRAGLPVVAWAPGGIHEVIDHNVTGFLVTNAETFRERTRALINDPSLRETIGAAGRSRYVRLLGSERMLAETAELYEALLGREHHIFSKAASEDIVAAT